MSTFWKCVVIGGAFLCGALVSSVLTAGAINGFGGHCVKRSDTYVERLDGAYRTVITFHTNPRDVRDVWIGDWRHGETTVGFSCAITHEHRFDFFQDAEPGLWKIQLDRPVVFKGVVMTLSPLRDEKEKDVWVDDHHNRYLLVQGTPPEHMLHQETVDCHWNPADRKFYIIHDGAMWRRER